MALTADQTAMGEETATTYRAAVVHSFDQPLTIERVTPPALEHGQIRVKIEACGLCHTDIHAAHGDWPVKPSPPFMPGHEGVGVTEPRGQVTEVRLATVSRCRGSAMRAAFATTVFLAGRRYASEQQMMGYSSMAASVSSPGIRPVRCAVPRTTLTPRRRTAHLRRCHHLQSGKGRRDPALGLRRDLRHRRPGPPRPSVRRDRRRSRHRSRPVTTTSSTWPETGSRPCSTPVETFRRGAAARRRRAAVALAVSQIHSRSLRLAAPRRHPRSVALPADG